LCQQVNGMDHGFVELCTSTVWKLMGALVRILLRLTSSLFVVCSRFGIWYSFVVSALNEWIIIIMHII